MSNTQELLHSTTDHVDGNTTNETKKSDFYGNSEHRSSSKSPSSMQRGRNQHDDDKTGRWSGEEKKWKQKIAGSKVIKRLMQPMHIGSGIGGHYSKDDGRMRDYDLPRLGEIPVRSKYYREDQEKSHFANNPTYLPLAELCGPPQPSSFTHTTRYQEGHDNREPNDDDEARGHAYINMDVGMESKDGDYQQAQQMRESSHVSYFQEDSVSYKQGSGHSIQASRVASNVSVASSIGPTGLFLTSQFRWIPKKGGGGGGGLGFNPFMRFRTRSQNPETASRPSELWMHAPNLWNEAQQQGNYRTPEMLDGTVSPEHEQRHSDGHSESPCRQSSYPMYPGCTSQSPVQQSTPPTHPHGATIEPLFYGPIGTIGIETSHKRRAFEQQHGTHGQAEGASYRSVEGKRTGIQHLTLLWCDVSLLRSARVVDSPRLTADDADGANYPSSNSPNISNMGLNIGGHEVYEVAPATRKKVRQCSQQPPSRSPSFYFKDEDLSALRVESHCGSSLPAAATYVAGLQKPVTACANQGQRSSLALFKTASMSVPAEDQREVEGVSKVAVSGVDEQEIASLFLSFCSSDIRDNEKASNVNEGNAGERSPSRNSDSEGESVSSNDEDHPRRKNDAAAGGSTHQHKCKRDSTTTSNAVIRHSSLRDDHSDFMNSSLMEEWFMSRTPRCGDGKSLSCTNGCYDGGEEAAAAAADPVPSRAPHHACVKSAGIAGARVAPNPQGSPSNTPQPQEHRANSSVPAVREAAVRSSGTGTVTALGPHGRRSVNNATDTHAPHVAASRQALQQGDSAGGPSNYNTGDGAADCSLGEQVVYESTFSMAHQRNSYSVTACDDAHEATFAFMDVYGVAKCNGKTASPRVSVMGRDRESSTTVGVRRDSRDTTVLPELPGFPSRCSTGSPALDSRTSKKRSSTIQSSKSAFTDRASASPGAHTRLSSTAQGVHVPVVQKSPQKLALKEKTVCPGGYLAPMTPPTTSKTNEAQLPHCAQINNNAVSTPGVCRSGNASTVPDLSEIVGGKPFTSLAYELPGI
ncbi:hypothetical protein, unknown function [Leishmania tarentolae]|uniref:Uncharacterized protein n=1 Tax=Leishmania tarentolae TaxID=5689 RepID=A0A640KEY3_LEITA|nr:hypothetical protein, unknown function [Leishmania tarentolae]